MGEESSGFSLMNCTELVRRNTGTLKTFLPVFPVLSTMNEEAECNRNSLLRSMLLDQGSSDCDRFPLSSV